MAIPDLVMRIFTEQENLVLAIDDPDVIELAKRIAFYSAMIDATKSDPDEDVEFQAEMLEFLEKTHTMYVEAYQEQVNDLLP